MVKVQAGQWLPMPKNATGLQQPPYWKDFWVSYMLTKFVLVVASTACGRVQEPQPEAAEAMEGTGNDDEAAVSNGSLSCWHGWCSAGWAPAPKRSSLQAVRGSWLQAPACRGRLTSCS